MPKGKPVPNSKGTQFTSGEVAVRNGSKGGKKRVENDRKRKTLRECAQIFASLKPTDQVIKSLEQLGIDSKNANYLMAMIVGVSQKAIKGDAKALKTITELMGEDVKFNLDVEKLNLDKSYREREIALREREIALREQELEHRIAIETGEVKQEDKVIIVNDLDVLENGKKETKPSKTTKGSKTK